MQQIGWSYNILTLSQHSHNEEYNINAQIPVFKRFTSIHTERLNKK